MNATFVRPRLKTHLELAREAETHFGTTRAKLALSVIQADFPWNDDRHYYAEIAADGDREALDALIGELEAREVEEAAMCSRSPWGDPEDYAYDRFMEANDR